MRAFVIFCLIAVAAAQYDYAQVQQEEAAPVSGHAQLSQPIQQQPQPQPQPIQQTEFNKEFYSYSAPDSEFEDGGGHEQVTNSVKRNIRVVFIRGPENAAVENAALQLAKSSSDDRTAIYVLQKQADVSELTNKLQAVQSNANNKPEVHFVKYRTQSDADNAQRTIQSQYDSLPGPSISHNAGSAPVLDFSSKPSSSGGYSSPLSSYLPPGRRF